MIELLIESKYNNMLIREYLREIHFFSRRILNAIKFDGGKILVNGERRTVRYRLIAGDLLTIHFPPEKRGDFMVPEDIPLLIIYEDNDIIVINKPPNMAITPSPLQRSGTIANGLLAYYEQKDLPYTVHVVTRLDRNTSGLLLIAKHRYSHSLLANLQQQNKVKRKYKAVVEGHLLKKQDVIKAPIDRKEGSIIERTVTETGKHAVTHYKTEKENSRHTLVTVQLETGRTHQIRVHFSHIGHPLAGDDLYGGSTQFIQRQALHCFELSFKHPLRKEEMFFQLPPPQDIKKLYFSE